MTMRGLAIATLVATLLAGCTTRQKIAGGGAGLAVVGIGLSFSNESRSEDEAMDTTGKIGIACLLGGLAVLFVAAALEESDDGPAPETKQVVVAKKPAAVPANVVAAQKRRDQAKALTKQAQDAAAAGDCPKVQELSAQVGALDRLYYGEIFMRDEAVQKCFQPVAPPPAADAPVLPPPVIAPPASGAPAAPVVTP